jgi:eukaryotic-like serine/threonine-protein kinase
MPLSAGTRLGQYEIVSVLGAGGMGEVYRARDTRLGRDVAVKVLPDSFVTDQEFRDRFEREAQAVAALSHPNIVQIFELGAHERHLYAAMELLDGETLRERLQASPLPLRKALDYAQQIAHGLAGAHARGVIHRDLKPENIFLTRDGRLKILDFGLAKIAAPPVGDVTGTVGGGTVPGAVMGTIGYMSPEQVRALPVDHRTDLFSFGAVLYEMATGRRAFSAPSSVETMHAILTSDPFEQAPQPAVPMPAGLQRVVQHCLEKNADERFHSARDLGFALQALSSPGSEAPVPVRRRTRWPMAVAIAGALALAATAAFVGWRLRPDVPAAPVVFNVPRPSAGFIGYPAVSPDGTRIAFLSLHDNWWTGDAIWVRSLDGFAAQKLEGTGGSHSIFWSPDGKSIGFFSGGKLKTIELATGKTAIVCDAASGYGGAWGRDGTILFSPDERGPIYRVNAGGGSPSAVTTLDPSRGDEAHRWPHLLADGRHFLYFPWSSTSTVRNAMVASLDGGAARPLIDTRAGAIVGSGYIFFAADMPPRLMAQAFDEQRLELKGAPFQAIADNNIDYAWGPGDLAASVSNNTLVYTTGKFDRTQLSWYSRSGQPLGTLGEAGTYYDPRISRDGERLVIEKLDSGRGSGDVWVADLPRTTFSRVTSAPGFENVAVFSPDGSHVAYSSDQERTARIYVKPAVGSGQEQLLIEGRGFPLDWSPDRRSLLYMVRGSSSWDVFLYDFEHRRSEPLFASPFNEMEAVFSPDSRWLAYVSDESQHPEVYVRSLANPGVTAAISTRGGQQPQWRRDGRELFYIAPDNTLMAVDIDTSGNRIRAGTPRPLFTATVNQRKTIRNNYAAAPDGQRFLVLEVIERRESPLVTILNWKGLIGK